jgi:hypothetical protein
MWNTTHLNDVIMYCEFKFRYFSTRFVEYTRLKKKCYVYNGVKNGSATT